MTQPAGDVSASPPRTGLGDLTRGSVRALLAGARVHGGERLLDVGTGPGDVAREARSRGAEVVAVDASSAMVRLARAAGVPAVQADAEQLPFPDDCFDVVVGNFLLDHLARPAVALAEFRRVLVPGGALALTGWDRPEANPALGLFGPALATTGPPLAAVPAGPDPLRLADDAALRALLAGWLDVEVTRPAWSLLVEPGTWFDAVAAGTRAGADLAQADPERRAEARERYVALAREAHGVAGGRVRLPAHAVLVTATEPRGLARFSDAFWERQHLLGQDVSALERWAHDHADRYDGTRMVGRRLRVSLVDPARDEAQVRALVPHPDLVDVRAAAYSRAHLQRVRDDVQRRTAGLLIGLGTGGGGVHALLRANAAELAAELHAEHGDALQLMVGGLDFPFRPDLPGLPPPGPPVSTVELPGLTATVLPARARTPSGQDVHGRVQLQAGAAPVSFTTASLAIGVLVDPYGEVLSGWSGVITGEGVSIHLEPGGSQSIPFAVGTASMDPAAGPLLPPGSYDLVVSVDVGLPEQTDGSWVTQPTPVELGPPDPPP